MHGDKSPGGGVVLRRLEAAPLQRRGFDGAAIGGPIPLRTPPESALRTKRLHSFDKPGRNARMMLRTRG